LDGATPDQVAKSVELVKLVSHNGLKMLAIIGPSYKDFDPGYKNPNAGRDFQNRCGWPQGSGELSKVSLTTFSQHLHSVLSAEKDANPTIDAFEIGNEYDGICFNGDVPNGHSASAEEIKTLLRGYRELLKTAAVAIRQYFPNAKIITFGIAHSDDRYDKGALTASSDKGARANTRSEGMAGRSLGCRARSSPTGPPDQARICRQIVAAAARRPLARPANWARPGPAPHPARTAWRSPHRSG
jgi:hypothetical protein